MGFSKFSVGEVFAVPLLRGGFAFGYATWVHPEGWVLLTNIFDRKTRAPTPPRDLERSPLLLRDLWVGRNYFLPGGGAMYAEPWLRTNGKVGSPALPGIRFASEMDAKMKCWRIDLSGERKPIHLSFPKADALGFMAPARSNIAIAGVIEAKLVRAKGDPFDYFNAWKSKRYNREQERYIRQLDREEKKQKKKRTKKEPAEQSSLFEHDGRWTFSMPIPAAPLATFEEHGRLGNGYDWEGVVRYLVEKRERGLARQLKYDPEADTFAVSSKRKDALEKVAALVRLALADEQVLAEAIDASEAD